MAEGPIGQQEIANREHIAPQKTGDNIAAKRVAPYYYDTASGNWQRAPSPYIPFPYDYVGVNTAGATTDVYTFYQGGSGGTLVATVTLTYSDSTKGTLTSVART